MKRRFPSGAEKRKKKNEREKCDIQQRNSLEKFITHSNSNSLQNVLNDSELETGIGLIETNETESVDYITEAEEKNKEETEGQFDARKGSTNCLTDNTKVIETDLQNENKKEEEITHIDDIGEGSIDCVYPNDIALWPKYISEKMIEYYLINKPCNIGDITNLRVEYTDRNRAYYRNLCDSNFYCLKANGTKELREWMLFSETSKCVYCYVCKLFSISITGRIDTDLANQIDTEQKYWREVLKRIIATVKLLASLGLAFRGHRENKESNRRGNFLSCLGYLAEFDSFLKNHLERYGDKGRGNVNYLSHNVCNEFICLMGEKVKEYLISEVQEALYYSIIVDSTPDLSHVDQLTFILRFVDKKGEIKERFFGFLQIENHDSAYLEKVVLQSLNDLCIDIKNCRGQTYDNAANMSGKYSGLQARLKEHVNTATYVPCASHTLNLIGNCAAESCSGALHYFDLVQNLYVYFSSSTRRWNILLSSLPDTQSKHIKRISDTRWAARADAVSALRSNYKRIKEALIQISTNDHEKPIGKLEARKLSENFHEYETALLTVLWDKLLQRINSTSKSLQEVQFNLLQGTTLLKSLSQFILDVRDNFEDIEKDANLLTENLNYKVSRIKKRKLQFGETSNNDICFTGKQSFIINIHNVICDVLISDRRSIVYNDVLKDFQVFFKHNMSANEINESVKRLVTKYENDIDIEYFKDEVLHFIKYVQEENVSNPVEMYRLLVDGLQSTFPNVETILRIFLTMPVCNASGERSFSVLKRVKNYLRSSLSQEHLSNLSLLFIENEVAQSLDYECVIDEFAKLKARKVLL